MNTLFERLGWNSEFVGRAAELAILSEQFAKSKNGSRAVVIRGPPGIGKTRLARHFQTLQKGAFHASVQARRAESELQEPVRRLVERIRKKAETAGDVAAVKLAEECLTLITTPKGRGLSGSRAIQESFHRLIQAVSGNRQSVILLDMVQWMERTSLDAMAGLFRAVSPDQVLVLICLRPSDADFLKVSDFLESLKKTGPVVEISLGPLAQAESERLVESTLRMPIVPKQFSSFIQSASGGNPMLIEEALDRAENDGSLENRGGQWSVSSKPVPGEGFDDIGALLDKRLARLDPGDLRTLQIASVIGEMFPLSRLKGVDEGTASEAVSRLQAFRFLAVDAEGDARFYNSDTHWHVYNAIDPSTRKAYHKTVFAYLSGQKTPPLVLANHLVSAGEAMAALPYLDEGAREAEQAYAISFSQGITRRGLDLLKSAPDTKATKRMKLSFLRRMGRCLHTLGEMGPATDRFLEAMELARALDDNAALGECLMWLGDILREKEEYDRAEVEYKKAVRILEREKDAKNLSLANVGLGKTYWKLNKYDDALAFIKKGIELAKQEKDQSLLGTGYIDFANVLMDKGDYAECIRHYNMAVEVLTAIENLDQLARVTNNIGEVYKHMGDFASAAESYRRCIEISVKAERLVTRGYGHLNLAEVLAKMGSYEEATVNAQRCMEIFERLQENSLLASCNMVFGLIKRGQKDWKGAEACFEKALGLMASDEGGQFDKGIIVLEYGRMLKEKGDGARSVDQFNRAQEIFDRIGAKEMAEAVRAELEIKDEAAEQMNRLARDVRAIIREEVGAMGDFVFKKQCVNLGLDPDSFAKNDIPGIAKAMGEALVMFSGEAKSNNVRDRILKLQRRA